MCKKEQKPLDSILIIAGAGVGLGVLYYLTKKK